GTGAYLPLGHTTGTGDIFGGGHAEDQMDMATAIDQLRPLLADPSILKIFHNAKYDLGLLARDNVPVNSLDDTLLLSYSRERPEHSAMAALADHWLGVPGQPSTALIGKGKTQTTCAQLDIAAAAPYGADDSDMTIRLWHMLKARLPA